MYIIDVFVIVPSLLKDLLANAALHLVRFDHLQPVIIVVQWFKVMWTTSSEGACCRLQLTDNDSFPASLSSYRSVYLNVFVYSINTFLITVG